jgi:G3E family GTPase
MLQGSSFDLGFCVAAWQDRGRNGDALMKRLFLAGIICVVDASAFWEMYNSGSFSMAAVVPSRWNHLESINHHSIS